MATGRQWAAASARTLSRRLRRSSRAELGTTRAQALSHRSALLRKAVVAHWELSDMLGAHYSEFADSVAAADVLGLTKRVSELKVAVADGAWARHSPPPGLSAALDAPNGVSASLLEQFREELYYQPDFAAPVTLDVVQIYDEQFGARIASAVCGVADPLVELELEQVSSRCHMISDVVESMVSGMVCNEAIVVGDAMFEQSVTALAPTNEEAGIGVSEVVADHDVGGYMAEESKQDLHIPRSIFGSRA